VERPRDQVGDCLINQGRNGTLETKVLDSSRLWTDGDAGIEVDTWALLT
jgi:hypothetical protein